VERGVSDIVEDTLPPPLTLLLILLFLSPPALLLSICFLRSPKLIRPANSLAADKPPSKSLTRASLHNEDARRGRRRGPENAFVLLVLVEERVVSTEISPVAELSISPLKRTGRCSWPQCPNEGPCKSSSASSSGLLKGKYDEEGKGDEEDDDNVGEKVEEEEDEAES